MLTYPGQLKLLNYELQQNDADTHSEGDRQTRGTVLHSMPQTTKFTLTQPYCTTNNTIQQT